MKIMNLYELRKIKESCDCSFCQIKTSYFHITEDGWIQALKLIDTAKNSVQLNTELHKKLERFLKDSGLHEEIQTI